MKLYLSIKKPTAVCVFLMLLLTGCTQHMEEVKFSGKITTIVNDAPADMVSYMMIDEQKVVFNTGDRQGEWGKVTGVRLESTGKVETFNGRRAKVFARRIQYEGYDHEGRLITVNELTLEGNENYYIRVK